MYNIIYKYNIYIYIGWYVGTRLVVGWYVGTRLVRWY